MSLASSNEDLCNMAISSLGSGYEIGTLSERSQEASACRRFFDTALQTVLRDFDWNFARTTAPLALIQDFRPVTYPNRWAFSYRVPPDCVCIRGIASGLKLDTLDSAPKFEEQNDGIGDLVLCDAYNPSMTYTALMTNVEQYPPDFVLAFTLFLSTLIAPRLTNGDPLSLGAKNYQKYRLLLSQAQKTNQVETDYYVERDCELIRTRDY